MSTNSPSVFNRDKFLLSREVLTISEYDVFDEHGNPILYIERPAYFLRNLGAALVGVIAGITVAILLFMLVGVASESLKGFLFLFALLSWFVVTFTVSTLLHKKRHVTIYRDKSKQEPLLRILQDKKVEFMTATFTLRDTNGVLAKFRKNYLYDIVRKNWYCESPDGFLLCVAKGIQEDSITLDLLRRVLFSPEERFRRYYLNFIIFQGNSDRVIGEFNHYDSGLLEPDLTLEPDLIFQGNSDRVVGEFNHYDSGLPDPDLIADLDRRIANAYLSGMMLDMSADQQHSLDRRIAIALGVMLYFHS
ncbi:MAG: hypothetical protein IM539_00620 [Pseudanabaena sp. M046S1SP1A06QC]|nr:hypothetical protein [Pseudanabaena sp. M046S1SP1A06QC]